MTVVQLSRVRFHSTSTITHPPPAPQLPHVLVPVTPQPHPQPAPGHISIHLLHCIIVSGYISHVTQPAHPVAEPPITPFAQHPAHPHPAIFTELSDGHHVQPVDDS
jgi:hypothetical protein